MTRGKANSPKASVAFGSLSDKSAPPIAAGEGDLPRPTMRVLQSDPPPPVQDAAPVEFVPPVVQEAGQKPKALYAQLDALLDGHLRTNHPDYAVLHPIIVSLAAAKFKAYEALETVRDPATVVLLQKIKAL